MSHPLELLILETVQLGGSLVFLSDQAPSTLPVWTGSLQKHFAAEIPFVVRRAKDLTNKRFATRPEDLVLFFKEQESLLPQMESLLSGQRALLGTDAARLTDSWDFIFSDMTMELWETLLQNLRRQWDQASVLQGLPGEHQTPCLFLDRDNVVVKDVPYNKDPKAVVLMPGIAELINRAHARGWWVALVTNQSGLGRGRITWDEYQSVHQQMLRLLAEQKAWIDDCEWSAFISESGTQRGRLLAGMRKPRNGMFLKINDTLKVNMSRSVMVGDSASDLKAAYAAGVKSLYLLASDQTAKQEESLKGYRALHPDFRYITVQSLEEISL
ncbi:HAD-IIIA family hydrolase [Bdellovibrio bacteriovorus]|uniref:D-glycero-alpha-D-manno-heptose-1,7-bisphosphate 7-phosphatase n=1 Tax=Bdellovibrio bacteriovorus TaxID=959 RepID=UPI0021CE5A84|nr:HAD-IIIA family hydrolase [Bdellovibrio bacteriovorus]UXR64627.1 HAD-IIIA family hydrolase [Bdellovibrio bacteriovorus]